jgi:hypothetical protein
VQMCYSPQPPDGADRAQAIETWRRLRWRLWLATLLRHQSNRKGK